ncbi:MAG: hypothetical protein Q9166_000820 [cf. Caloplaca sp. 2 TL-2023]
MKRAHPADDEEPDDSEDSEMVRLETAQTNPRQDTRKKARLSYEGSDAGTSGESSDDEEIIEEQETSFRTQQQSSGSLGNTPADNGILESVSCSNFMCHSYLEVPLGPLINFIIGHNGSGKSAILTAITICLGGKATATNRGQSLKSFIKEGTESAVLSVKIKNKGDSAYQSEVYGDSIIVERHFTRSGTSNFKLKSSTGRLISTRKADLEEICDYFALQIDNPMNVLTQDMARQFLSNSTPQEKYKFFMKGTQLEHLDGDYLQIEQSIDRIDQDLAKSLADVGAYETEARKAKATLELSQKHDTLRDNIRNLGWQMAWAQVEEVEQSLVGTDGDLVKIAEYIANAERKRDQSAEVFDSADISCRDAAAVVQELQEFLVPHNDKKDQAKQDNEKLKGGALSSQAEQRKIKDAMKQAEARIKRAESDIEDEYRRLEEINGGSHARRLAEIDEKRSQLADAKTRMNEHDNGLNNLENERRQAAQSLENSKDPISEKRQDVQKCEERLNRLIRDHGMQERAYHANLPRLRRAIQEERGFQQRPIGPIGYHVRLRKASWSSILEKSFGGTLNSFIVTSKPDQIDEDLVRKQLIITQAIEQTILMENRAEAVNLMSDARLDNVKQCFVPNEKAKSGAGIRYNYGWGGALASGYIPPWSGAPRMKTDVEFQVNACRSELQRLRTDLNDLERTMRERQTNLKNCEQAIIRHKRESRDLRVEMQRLEADVEGLQDALDRDSLEEGKVDALKEGLQEAREELSTYTASFELIVVAMDEARENMRKSREKMKAIDDEVAEIQAKIRKAESKAMKLSERRDAALRDKNAAFAALEEGQKSKEATEKKRADVAETVGIYIEQASLIHERVPVENGETAGSLEKKLEKLQSDLEKWEARLGGSPQEIADAASRKVRAFQQAKKQVEDIERLAQLLKTTLVNRKERWKLFQRAITARARVQFMWMLSERSFRGRLLANHKEKKLDLVVEPDPTKVGKGREAKTLSGGEKSFSTICLLLSLWDAMGAPVRCLDEFDVFMDSVNREVSMRKMIEAARYSIGKQFVLITPGSMGSVSSSHDVKIIK